METLKLDISKTGVAVSAAMQAKAQAANALLESGKGAGSDFLGWVHLPSSITPDRIEAIEKQAAKLREKAEVIICIGIGGSYLGAKAVLEAMSDSFKFLHKKRTEPVVVFAGQNISEDYTHELLEAVKEYSIATIVISKSGTTTEPAIAFRLIKAEIEKRYGKQEAAERIVAITDKARGALKTLADNEGYPTFVIPDDVGGRFSVLTPVGLLPLAAAGVDIAALVRGAQEMERATADGTPFEKNPAAVYAAVRNELYEGGKKIEILGSYEPKLQYINEWWKQLYGESEGKDGKGIFPASVTLTADLHSMGQYIQDGERTLFETIISVAEPAGKVVVEADGENLDGLNFLAGKRISEINRMAELGVDVFQDGGVLDAVQVGRVAQVNVVRGEFLAQHLGVLRVGADHREVGELAARDLLGVRRAGDDADLFVRQVVAVVDVFDDGLVVAGNDALDGRDDEFVLQRDRQRFEERLEVGRRSGQNDDVGFADHLLEVVGGGDAPAVELHVAQIAGVAAFAEQSFEHFGIADVPAYAGFVRGEQPHDGRRPAAVADHGAAGLFSDFVFHVRIDCFGLQM